MPSGSSYNWDKNRIYLSALFVDLPHGIDVKLLCKRLISKIRLIGGVSDDGTVLADYSRFARNFGHADYKTKNEPDDYRRKLDQIIEVSASVETPDTFTDCHGPLVSNKVYFEE